MEIRWVVTVLAVAGIQVLMGWIARRSPKIDHETGAAVLEYGWPLRALGLLFGVGVPAAILVLLCFKPPKSTDDYLPIAALVLGFGLLGGLLLVEALKVRLIVADDGVYGVSPWRKPRFIRWQEIEDISFSRMNSWFVIADPRKQKIRASFYLTGIRSLAAAIEENVSPARYRNAVVGLALLGQDSPMSPVA